MLACTQHLWQPSICSLPPSSSPAWNSFPGLFSFSSSRLRLHSRRLLYETFLDYSEFLVCLLTVRSELYGVFSLSTQLEYEPLKGSFACPISLCFVQCIQTCAVWMARGHRAAQGTVTGVRLCTTSFGRRGQTGGCEDRLCDAALPSPSLSTRDPHICVTFMISNGSRVLAHCICLFFCPSLCGHFLVLHPASCFSAGKKHWQVLHYLCLFPSSEPGS